MAGVKGKSGGPRPNSGRPPSNNLDAVRSLLDESWSPKEREEAIKKQATRASQGDRGALSFLMAYCYGRPPALDELEIQARVEAEYDAFINKIKTHLDAPTFQKVIEVIGAD